ncbi:MAG: DUF86 domain-containing protein [Anaerolineae bacterium]|jgi:uncharacterized protein with HEPN domain
MQRETAYLLDILQSALLVQEFVQGLDERGFRADQLRQDAVIRRIEVIGEATRRISPEFRAAHPGIPWPEMAGMRSRLIHEYDRVDLVEVWKVVQEDIPRLIAMITPLVPPDRPADAI